MKKNLITAHNAATKHILKPLVLSIICSINASAVASEMGIIATASGPNVSIREGQVVIDIKPPKPDSAGLSHNTYDKFNTDQRGAIFNNPSTIAANIILNEVISTHASHLEGVLRVQGKRADVIIANPNGITCNGCGFDNVHSGILTTGKPQFNGNQLTNFKVETGSIVIGEQGLISYATQQVDPAHIALIAATVNIKGHIHGKKEQDQTTTGELYIIAGRQRVTLKHPTESGELIKAIGVLSTAKQPQANNSASAAIDINKLGGMYARKIYLTSTEMGVGVNSAGLIHACDDIIIAATASIQNQPSGRILSDQGNIVIKSQSHLSASSLFTNQGDIRADKDIYIFAQNFRNNISPASLTAKFWLSSEKNIPSIHAGNRLYIFTQQGENIGGILNANHTLNLKSITGQGRSGNFTNQSVPLYLSPDNINRLFSQAIGGTIAANIVEIELNEFTNQGNIEEPPASTTDSNHNDEDAGKILASKSATINVNKLTNIGATIKGDTLNITANTVHNQSGLLDGWKVTINAKDLVHKTKLKTYTHRQEKWENDNKKNRVDYYRVDKAEKQSQIHGHDIRLNIDNDLHIEGASIEASGQATLTVGKKITITGLVQEKKYSQALYEYGSKESLVKDYVWRRTDKRERIDQIALDASIHANELSIIGGMDIVLSSATLESNKKATIQSTTGHIHFKALQLSNIAQQYLDTDEAWRTLVIPGEKQGTSHELFLHFKHRNTQMAFGDELNILAPQGNVYIGNTDFVFLPEELTSTATTGGKLNVKAQNIQTHIEQNFDQTQKSTHIDSFGIQYEGHSSLIDPIKHATAKFDVQGSKQAYVKATILHGAQAAGDVSNIMLGDTLGGSIDLAFGIKDTTESSQRYSMGASKILANHTKFEATHGDVQLIGLDIRSLSKISSINVNAKRNIFLGEAQNHTLSQVDSKDQTFSLGGMASANVYLGAAGAGIRASYNRDNNQHSQTTTSFIPMTLQANTQSFSAGGNMDVYGVQILAENIALDIKNTLKIKSVQDRSDAHTTESGWGGSLGVDANLYTVFAPNFNLHAKGGRTDQHSALTSAKSGMIAKKITGKIKELWLIGGALIADASAETLDITDKIKADSLLDTQNQTGFVIGGGLGYSVNGLPMGSFEYNSPELLEYRLEQLPTCSVNVCKASVSVDGLLNTDAKNMTKLIVNDRVGTVTITGIFATVPKNAYPKTEEINPVKQSSQANKTLWDLSAHDRIAYSVALPEGTNIPSSAAEPTIVNNGHYIRIDNEHYAVSFDNKNKTWRIFAPGQEYTKATLPVKFENGRWQLHGDIAKLRGGGKDDQYHLLDEDSNNNQNPTALAKSSLHDNTKDSQYHLLREDSSHSQEQAKPAKQSILRRLQKLLGHSKEVEPETIPGYREDMTVTEIRALLRDGNWTHGQKKMLKEYKARAQRAEAINTEINNASAHNPLSNAGGKNVHWITRLTMLSKTFEITSEEDKAAMNHALVQAVAAALPQLQIQKSTFSNRHDSKPFDKQGHKSQTRKLSTKESFYNFYGIANLAKKLDEAVHIPDPLAKAQIEKLNRTRYPSGSHTSRSKYPTQHANIEPDSASTFNHSETEVAPSTSREMYLEQKQVLKEGLIQLSHDDSAYHSLGTLTANDAINRLPESGNQFFSLKTPKHEILIAQVESENKTNANPAKAYVIYDPHVGLYFYQSKVDLARGIDQHFSTNRLAEEFYGASLDKFDKPLFNVSTLNPEVIKTISIGNENTVNNLIRPAHLVPPKSPLN